MSISSPFCLELKSHRYKASAVLLLQTSIMIMNKVQKGGKNKKNKAAFSLTQLYLNNIIITVLHTRFQVILFSWVILSWRFLRASVLGVIVMLVILLLFYFPVVLFTF